MAHSDGQPQQKRLTGIRSSSSSGYVVQSRYQEPYERDTQTSLNEVDFEGDFMDAPPRASSSAIIRRTSAVSNQRITDGQAKPVARRTTQQKPASMAAVPTTPYPRSSTRISEPLAKKPRRKNHLLLPVGIGMIAMIVLWMAGSAFMAWWSVESDNLTYGTPRTYQTDAVVGHGGDSEQHPSHFMAINLNRQAVIIEFMAGNPTKSISYVVPYYILGQGGDLTPIKLEFRDVNGDGKPDMIIHILLHPQDQTFVFINDGTKFRPPTNTDNIHL